MRYSTNETIAGVVKNGFDYSLQVWVNNYIIIDCNHPDTMKPNCCQANKLARQDIREIKEYK